MPKHRFDWLNDWLEMLFLQEKKKKKKKKQQQEHEDQNKVKKNHLVCAKKSNTIAGTVE